MNPPLVRIEGNPPPIPTFDRVCRSKVTLGMTAFLILGGAAMILLAQTRLSSSLHLPAKAIVPLTTAGSIVLGLSVLGAGAVTVKLIRNKNVAPRAVSPARDLLENSFIKILKSADPAYVFPAPSPAMPKGPIEENIPFEELAHEEDIAGALKSPEGIRTKIAYKNAYNFQECDSATNTIKFEGKDYKIVSGNLVGFSKKPVASVGGSKSREILLLDPTNCPLLDQHYQTLMTKIKNSHNRTFENIFNIITEYIRTDMMPRTEDKVRGSKFILNRTNNTPVPVLNIEDYLRNKTGVCRHHALVLSYILDRMVNEKRIICGIPVHVRTNVPGGAHAWVAFIRKTSRGTFESWHIDSLWKVCLNVDVPSEGLKLLYGQQAMAHEQNKINAAKDYMGKNPNYPA